MTPKRFFLFSLATIAATLLLTDRRASAQTAPTLVRLAELEIDPAALEAYTQALKLEMESSIRTEPGVLTLYAVAVKDHPNQVRLFEQYRDQAAYQAHLHSPHFLRYKAVTAGMVQSLRLLETEPILLADKPR